MTPPRTRRAPSRPKSGLPDFGHFKIPNSGKPEFGCEHLRAVGRGAACGTLSRIQTASKFAESVMSVLTQHDVQSWHPPATWPREQVIATSDAVLAKPAGEAKETED